MDKRAEAAARTVKHSLAVQVYLAEAQRKRGMRSLSLTEGRRIIDTAMGEKLLSEAVIEARE